MDSGGVRAALALLYDRNDLFMLGFIQPSGRTLTALSAILLANVALASEDAEFGKKLADMSLEELLQLEVTSMSRKSQNLADVPAAAFVITADDIRRSGVTSIPEALRLVPGLEVAQITSNRWAISARGFNGRFANKLQVLIDGRSVYSPTFSGVYWEVQDTVIEDIERIEVVRGPGASLWGANAVNGVINVITKSAADTQGGRFTFGAGTYERRFGSLRYGFKLGEKTLARVFMKGFARDGWRFEDGNAGRDTWQSIRGGFRLEHEFSQGSSLTLMGETYGGDVNQRLTLPRLRAPFNEALLDPVQVSGSHILGRWKRSLGANSEISLQGFFDHTFRKENYATEERETFELDFQHRFLFANDHDVVWGLSYRSTSPRYALRQPVAIRHGSRTRDLISAFLQDEMTLLPDQLKLILGAKLEYNEFTGWEGQPNARLLWKPQSGHTLWTAVSRAVRTPSVLEDSGTIGIHTAPAGSALSQGSPVPVYVRLQGSKNFRTEALWAYELGYRFAAIKQFSADLAAFYNVYDHLRSIEGPVVDPFGGPIPTVTGLAENRMHGRSYGVELQTEWRPEERWRLQASYTFLRSEFKPMAGSVDNSGGNLAGSNPRQQFALRAGYNPISEVDLDLWGRYVDSLPTAGISQLSLTRRIPAYFTLDARAAWRPWKDLELSIVGRNLLDPNHPEFYQEFYPSAVMEAPRSVYLKADWQF